MDEDEEARAKRREEAAAEAGRLSALERAKLSSAELKAAMDEAKPAPPAVTAGDAAGMAAVGEVAPRARLVVASVHDIAERDNAGE